MGKLRISVAGGVTLPLLLEAAPAAAEPQTELATEYYEFRIAPYSDDDVVVCELSHEYSFEVDPENGYERTPGPFATDLYISDPLAAGGDRDPACEADVYTEVFYDDPEGGRHAAVANFYDTSLASVDVPVVGTGDIVVRHTVTFLAAIRSSTTATWGLPRDPVTGGVRRLLQPVGSW